MKDITDQKVYVIDEMFGDFGFYRDPDLLKPEFQKLINPKLANISGVEKYLGLLSNVGYAWKKVLKYEIYFEKFYVADNSIEGFEALNHHIHAYLQDMDTLKNKIKLLLDNLKKDLKHIASNKQDVISFIDAGNQKNFEVFDGVLEHRRQHVHKGMRFTDGDLLKAETAHFSLEMFANPVFDVLINQKYKPELITKFQKEKKESFENAKTRWVEMARKNNTQVTGWLDSLLRVVRPSLYQFLKIKSVHGLINATQNKK